MGELIECLHKVWGSGRTPCIPLNGDSAPSELAFKEKTDVERLEKLLCSLFHMNTRNEILCDTDVLASGGKVTKSYQSIPEQLGR